MPRFKRVAAGRYRDDESSWELVRSGPAVTGFSQVDWLVKDQHGTVQRVSQSKTEAEMAAHKALGVVDEVVHYQEPWERHAWCGETGATSAKTDEVTCQRCTAASLADEALLASLE
jgi:hypothetical protein